MTDTSFANNTASDSGGAIFTAAPTGYEIRCGVGTEDEAVFAALDAFDPESCGWLNNTVLDGYGDDLATGPVALTLSPTSIDAHASGDTLQNMTVSVVDARGQRVLGAESLIDVSLPDPNDALAGQRSAETVDSVARFDGTFLRAKPGDYVLEFKVAATGLEARLPVSVRGCRAGEVESLDGKACEECQAGHYSFDPNAGCELCPEGDAQCNVSTIVPLNGEYVSHPGGPKVLSPVLPNGQAARRARHQAGATGAPNALYLWILHT